MAIKEINKKFQKLVLAGGILIILIFLALSLGLSIRHKNLLINQLNSSAEGMFDSILFTRRWNADYSGVYVLKDKGVTSNPFLENPDIRTIDGKVYTLRNPAMMTREISEYARDSDEFTYHITSLKLTNPANEPDEWERQALQAFEREIDKVTKLDTLQGRKVFRLMRPLKYETGCTGCHSKQGYQLGDIRGGISVAIPFDKISAELKLNQWIMIVLSVLIILVLSLVLYFFVWRLVNQLIVLNEQKNEFLGIAAHDLRNPLGVIMGYSQLLLEGLFGFLDEKQTKFVSAIRKSSNTMHNLINDLLDTSKIESGKLGLNVQETDLISLCRENVELNSAMAKKKRIQLHFEYDENIPKVMLDPDKIDQVLNNLITNAIKFSYPDTTIRVSLSKNEHNVLIEVQDEGQGVPENELDTIFKSFSKSSVRSTGGEKSTGLGLAIVRKIVEGHHGSIRVESEVGKGSIFYVYLPIEKNNDCTWIEKITGNCEKD